MAAGTRSQGTAAVSALGRSSLEMVARGRCNFRDPGVLVKVVQYDGTCTGIYCTVVEAELHQSVDMAFLDSNICVPVNQTVIQVIFKPFCKPCYKPHSNHIQAIFKPYTWFAGIIGVS